MLSSSSASFFCVFISTLILLQVHGEEEEPLSYFCDHSGSPGSSTYQTNLRALVKDLIAQVPKTGFSDGSNGKGSDTVYGLAQCRDDVDGKSCELCVSMASQEIQNLCPNNKSMIIWYDSCEVKFSPEKFLGKIDTKNIAYLASDANLTSVPSFVSVTSAFLLGVSKHASRTLKLYAAEKEDLDCKFLTLYGLAQCTRDISKETCAKCLESAVKNLSTIYPLRQGARVLGGTCNARYEIYPFFQSS